MIVFDDAQTSAFYPLTLNRSVGDLRCGILKLRQRLQQALTADNDAVWIAERLAPWYRERHPDWAINAPAVSGELLVNSRLMPSDELWMELNRLKPGQCLCDEETVQAVVVSGSMSALPDLAQLKQAGYELLASGFRLYDKLSDLIHDNDRLLRYDFERYFYDKDNSFDTEPGVTVLHPYQIWIGEGVELKPGVVLDASAGPIVLDAGVRILPNAVITGPVYLGKGSLVKVGAKIYGPTAIGPVCKVGGEVEGSIFQAYSNKQHDGFLGHSYVGEWVNIGADANNSDLKNTYSNVSFYSYPERVKVDSGSIFLGALIADHVKLGINTTINTGCVIGLGSNLWGSDLISDFIPDFSWGMASSLVPYKFPAFCLTAKTVKNRREVPFSDAEKELLSAIWKATRGAH